MKCNITNENAIPACSTRSYMHQQMSYSLCQYKKEIFWPRLPETSIIQHFYFPYEYEKMISVRILCKMIFIQVKEAKFPIGPFLRHKGNSNDRVVIIHNVGVTAYFAHYLYRKKYAQDRTTSKPNVCFLLKKLIARQEVVISRKQVR